MLAALLLLCSLTANAQTDTTRCDTVRRSACVSFAVNEAHVNPRLGSNYEILERIGSLLDSVAADTTRRLHQLHINSYSSPDGPYATNARLARHRANSLSAYLTKHLPAQSVTPPIVRATAEDWEGLVRFIEHATDTQLPHRTELLRIASSNLQPDSKERQLRHRFPADYDYLRRYVLPALRRAEFHIVFTQPAPAPIGEDEAVILQPEECDDTRQDSIVEVAILPSIQERTGGGRLFILRTNLLLDALAVPNVGVEIELGKRWSVVANWAYAWWYTNPRHRYWQTYGGSIVLRRWFGSRENVTQVNGHHLGLYAQYFTYDFEWGGRGYQSATGHRGGGIEYGYAFPIGRRLSLDCSIGIGYLGGQYKEYLPIDTHYVWQSTHQRHWVGPTRAEVSLAWRLPPLRWKGGEP